MVIQRNDPPTGEYEVLSPEEIKRQDMRAAIRQRLDDLRFMSPKELRELQDREKFGRRARPRG